jgi:hypothetical protein
VGAALHISAAEHAAAVARLHAAGEAAAHRLRVATAAASRIDPTSGCRMFAPATGRPPSAGRAAGTFLWFRQGGLC